MSHRAFLVAHASDWSHCSKRHIPPHPAYLCLDRQELSFTLRYFLLSGTIYRNTGCTSACSLFCITWRDLDLVPHPRSVTHLPNCHHWCPPAGWHCISCCGPILLCLNPAMLEGWLEGTAQLIRPPVNPVLLIPTLLWCTPAQWVRELNQPSQKLILFFAKSCWLF